MKNLYTFLLGRLINGVKQGISEYAKTFSKEDPNLTLYIFGWLGKIGKGLWNGVKGAIGGFFGKGGAVTIAGAKPTAPAIVTIKKPEPVPDEGKPNILLYVGIGIGVIIFVIIIIMMMKKR